MLVCVASNSEAEMFCVRFLRDSSARFIGNKPLNVPRRFLRIRGGPPRPESHPVDTRRGHLCRISWLFRPRDVLAELQQFAVRPIRMELLAKLITRGLAGACTLSRTRTLGRPVRREHLQPCY